ncbi:MAG TPA: efflux RND transporter periplasmic adaptor subunit [Steroidobacteraceae bacterium]|nr:efflux RND transporter periplasmic adaptor subunit [Steroidobacteraceae bacterium]
MEHFQSNGKFAVTRGTARAAVVIGVVLALLLWGILASLRAGAKLREQTEEQAIVTVATVHPQLQTDATALTLPGSVQANYDAPIYARTNGYLKRWLVDIGTRVKAGQLLAEIDAPELDQQLRQAEADLANAVANRNIANITAERWRGLRDTDSVSKQEADEKISLAETSTAQLQAAQANRQRLRELSAFKRILAPFDGVVTVRNTDVGQLINAGGAGPELFRIADTGKLRLYVHVPQAYAAMMQPALTAEVRFPDRPGETYNATLERTSNAIDASTRTLLAQLIVDNSKAGLLPGAYAEVRFQLPASGATAALRLPANVLLTRGDALQVATVNSQGHVALKTVTLGRDFGAEIEVVGGLTPQDDVIVSPPDSLTETTVVRVAKPTAAEKS